MDSHGQGQDGVAFTATLAERDDYVAWFVGSGGSLAADSIPMDGARSFFLQSGLPNDTLSHVWRLANRASLPNGALNFVDFCVAAHLLMRIARKQLDGPPTTLSPTFFAHADAFAKGKPAPPAAVPNPFPSATSSSSSSAAAPSSLLLDDFGSGPGSASSPVRATPAATSPLGPIDTHRTGASVTHTHPSAVPTHRTGGSMMGGVSSGSPMIGTPRTIPPIPVPRPDTILEMPTGAGFAPARGPSPLATSTLSRAGGAEWAVPADKQATYAGYFTQVDVGAKGHATGAECFDMFTKSGLPTTDLSKIWNLVSTESGGVHLRKDDFIVAMHLIFEKLAGKPIPDTLPSDLIPPSRRSGATPGAFSDYSMKTTSSTVSLASVIGGGGGGSPARPASPPPVSKPSTFDDIIGGGTSRASAIPPASSTFSVPTPARAPTLPPASTPAPAFGSSLYGPPPTASTSAPPPTSGGGLLSSSLMASLPAAALPEAKELSDLVTKTESLTTQRIESTHALNQISIERQNLQIRLDQARVTHDAEERILKEMKAALERETAAVKELKVELADAEKKRGDMQEESRALQEQMRKDKLVAEELRAKLVALNLEIAGMRQEINKLRDEAARDKAARESAEQTAQNVEDAKGLVQMTLEQERSKKMERDVLGGSPIVGPAKAVSPRTGSVESVGMMAARPLSTVGSIGAASPSARPGSIGSPSAVPFTLEALGKSPVMDPFPVTTNRTGNSVASGTGSAAGFGGSANVITSNPALATDRAKSPAGIAPPSSTSAKSYDMSAAMANFPSPSQLPTMPLSPPPPLPGMGSPAQAPAPPAAAPVDPTAIPEDLKKQFEEDFAFDFPAPVPAATATSGKAPASNDSDPFAAFNPAGSAAAPGPASAPSSATMPADAFDPFAFSGPAVAPVPSSSAPSSAVPPPTSGTADASKFDPFAAFNAPAAGAAGPAPASVPTSPDPFAGFDSVVPHSPPTQAAGAAAAVSPVAMPAAVGVGRSPSPTSGGDPVATVMAMGFTKEQATDALERYDFKPELAINYLFDQQNAK